MATSVSLFAWGMDDPQYLHTACRNIIPKKQHPTLYYMIMSNNHQSEPPTFGDLFQYLYDRIEAKESDKPYQLVEEFISQHALDSEELIPVLQDLGGYDDLEVLLNVVDRIGVEKQIV